MKAFFKAIRQNDYDKVKSYLDSKPELANCIAKAPPKKDDGQSPLQVAFKVGDLQIANLLIDRGANINYIETSDINEWNIPVLHDFIRGLTARACRGNNDAFEQYLKMFDKLILLKVDFSMCDSYGNTSLDRLILDTNLYYEYDHKVAWDNKEEKYILSTENRDKKLEQKLYDIYNIFLDEYLKTQKVEIDIDSQRNAMIYDEFKIETFSIELLNELLIKKQGYGLDL